MTTLIVLAGHGMKRRLPMLLSNGFECRSPGIPRLEFRAGLALLTSKDSRERAVGAEILGQLGWQDRTFLEESVNALLGALIDTDDHVLQSVIFALGHRADPRAIEALLPFVDNPSAVIRYATVHGLMPHDVPNVVTAVAKLARDSDRDVRNWATFTLGSQFESKSPTLCAALQERVTDSDPEIRGEACAPGRCEHCAHCST